ncbi:hypothetical protein GVAV_000949, partial [Gurleya vavrai]
SKDKTKENNENNSTIYTLNSNENHNQSVLIKTQPKNKLNNNESKFNNFSHDKGLTVDSIEKNSQQNNQIQQNDNLQHITSNNTATDENERKTNQKTPIEDSPIFKCKECELGKTFCKKCLIIKEKETFKNKAGKRKKKVRANKTKPINTGASGFSILNESQIEFGQIEHQATGFNNKNIPDASQIENLVNLPDQQYRDENAKHDISETDKNKHNFNFGTINNNLLGKHTNTELSTKFDYKLTFYIQYASLDIKNCFKEDNTIDVGKYEKGKSNEINEKIMKNLYSLNHFYILYNFYGLKFKERYDQNLHQKKQFIEEFLEKEFLFFEEYVVDKKDLKKKETIKSYFLNFIKFLKDTYFNNSENNIKVDVDPVVIIRNIKNTFVAENIEGNFLFLFLENDKLLCLQNLLIEKFDIYNKNKEFEQVNFDDIKYHLADKFEKFFENINNGLYKINENILEIDKNQFNEKFGMFLNIFYEEYLFFPLACEWDVQYSNSKLN